MYCMAVILSVTMSTTNKNIDNRAATAGKAPQALPRFMVSTRSYKKQLVKKKNGALPGSNSPWYPLIRYKYPIGVKILTVFSWTLLSQLFSLQIILRVLVTYY